MQTTITSKSGKTYEITADVKATKTHGTYVTDADGKLIRGEDGNWLKTSVEDTLCASAKIDGKRLGYYVDPTQAGIEKKILVAAKRYAETAEADEVWYPKAKPVAANFGYSDNDIHGTSAADFFVGQLVAVWGHGGGRVGLVEKVGKKNVGVIYVVASSGAMWRKSMPFEKVVILDLGPSEEELDEAEAASSSGLERCSDCGGTKPTYKGRCAGCRRAAERAADKRDQDAPVERATEPATAAEILGTGPAESALAPRQYANETERRLAGLRCERRSLRARIPAGTNLRPELQARLALVEAEIAALEERPAPAGISTVALRGIRKMADDGLTVEAIAEKTGLLPSEVWDSLEAHQQYELSPRSSRQDS